jgi:hypothetical protein
MKKGTFRKIVALGTGLTMLGATVFGAAAAADLSQYPSPLFIQDGKFVGNIVVGKAASTEDVLGAIELAASLQTAAVKVIDSGSSGALTASVDKENTKIEQTGRDFAYGDSMRDVLGAAIDFSDLPTLLKQGTFKDNEGSNKDERTYMQTLDFPTTTGKLEYRDTANTVYDDAADSYLWFDRGTGKQMYTYTLDFDTGVTYDNTSTTLAATDLENNVIEIQGNKYTITDVTLDGGRINKMELLAGETVVWMTQAEPLKRTIGGTEHTVALTDVNEDADKCGISVDGTTTWVDKGSTETINGVQIGVTDAVVVHSAAKDTDVCQVNVGATKITLQQNDYVKKDSTDIDGSKSVFKFDNTATAARWDGFNITYIPADDKIFLKAGTHQVDPVLENFQFDFAGMTRVDETFQFDGGSSPTLQFKNYDGKEVTIEWKTIETATRVVLGTDSDRRLLIDGDKFKCGTDYTACENQQLFYVTSGHVLHILEITKVDDTNSKVNLRDLTYGVDYKDKSFVVDGAAHPMDLGSLGTLTMSISDAGVIENLNLGDAAHNAAYTQYKGYVNLQQGGSDLANILFDVTSNATGVNATFSAPSFKVVEKVSATMTDGTANYASWLVNASYDTSDRQFNWNKPVMLTGAMWNSTSGIEKTDSDRDTKYLADEWGTIVEYDTSSNTDGHGKIMVPKDQAYGNAFISKVGAIVSTGTGVGVSQIQQIQVGTAKLDTDITDVAAQNLLVVGGPCANNVASTLMGSPSDCAAGFVAGEAILKLWQQPNGNVALLVAGYAAADTRRASKVLANYKDYTLSGAEMKVKGTTMSDITVSAVTA